MKAVIQRVKKAVLYSNGQPHSSIDFGMVVFLGIEDTDNDSVVQKIADKILRLRIFEDDDGKTNKSIFDIGGQIMVVSNFTLCANLQGTNRPDFTHAKRLEEAQSLYDKVIATMQEKINVATGVFRTDMQIETTLDGPCNYILEIKN